VTVHITHPLLLRTADELEALPARSTVAELIEDDVDRGWVELLPERCLRASMWFTEVMGERGGSYDPAWWDDDPWILSNAVHLFRVCDGYYMPRFGLVISSSGEVMRKSMAQASYRSPDLSALPNAERRGEATFLKIPGDIRTLGRVVVSMPWGAVSNYGHFVLDALPTVASVCEIPELEHYRFAFPALKTLQRRHLQLVGVEDPIELDDQIYRVSDLLFSSCMASFLHGPNVTYRMLRDTQLARRKRTGLSFEKVYITRRENQEGRRFLSEQILEERLRELGFAIVAAEKHSIDEQIDIFRNADLIVGCTGAGFANVLYCRENTTIIEITPERMATSHAALWVCKICAVVGCRWRPYLSSDVDVPPEKPILVGGVDRPELGFSFDLDIDDLVGYIKSFAR
jgi:capsular polysaccharide biosynthesis protein